MTHPERGEGPATVRRRRRSYAAMAAALAVVVGSAALDGATEVDVWGPSTDVVEGSGGGYELEVRHPTVTRPALATPFDIVVRRADGFDRPVEIAIDPDWIAMWDYQSLYPEPSESAGDPSRVIWTFEPPDGDVLRVFLDARIQPSQQSGRRGWVAVLDDEGAVAVRVDFATTVRP